MATGLKLLLTALLLSAPQLAASADLLPDPTLPAIDLNSSGAGSAKDVVPDEPVSRGLQSIIISPQYSAAVINGETVPLGGKSGDSRLVEVRENSVVLQNAQGRRVVELFPKVNIKKNETAPQERHVQEKASGQTSLPENAVGGFQ
jgi:MSHA biogenesis protein MshK